MNGKEKFWEFFEDGEHNIKTPEVKGIFEKIYRDFKAHAEKKTVMLFNCPPRNNFYGCTIYFTYQYK